MTQNLPKKHRIIAMLENIERELIIKALSGRTYKHAAFTLGISERTLYRKINYYLRPHIF